MGSRKSKAELITEVEAAEIFKYFKNHTAASTITHFALNRSVWNILCAKYNVQQHSSSEAEMFKHMEQDGYDSLTEAQIKEIYNMYDLCGTVEETIEKCKVKEYFLVYLLKLQNIVPKHRVIIDWQWREHLGKEKIAAILEFYCKPNTLVDTVNEFNVPVGQVRALVLENNLPLHDKATTERLGKAKQKNNLMVKFGVTNVFQLDEVKEKIAQTKLTRYNDSTFTNQAKREATCLEKYGSKSFLSSEQGKQAVIDYNQNKFGTDYAFQSDAWQHNEEYIKKRLDTIHDKKYNLDNYSAKYLEVCKDADSMREFIKDKTAYEVATELMVPVDHIYYLLSKYDLLDLIKKEHVSTSHYEAEIANFIGKDLCIMNDRTVLAGKEIDIYIPSKKIGIEFNGTYWHSTEKNPDHKYHFNKSIEAEKAGIRLIHIYEYEWIDPVQREKIKQMLDIALGRVKSKIYARDCEVRQISNKEARALNEAVHLQGHRNASVTYGLFYKDVLVQLMSFSKTKYNRNLKSDNSWEIIRGCPGSNNIVIGGVSKLFKHFIRDYSPDRVFSYCDFNKFNGKSYEELGMKFIGYTGPDMKWILGGGIVVNRNPKQHAKLKSQAIAQIFGAGSKKYLWEAKD